MDVLDANNTQEAVSPLADLSDDLTARILVRLRPREIAAVALTCKRLATVCADDARVWQPLCAEHWSAYTDPERWLVRGSSLGTPGSSGGGRPTARPSSCHDDDGDEEAPAPSTYRSVFATLRRYQPLIGLWRGVGDAPTGSLFRVSWGPPPISNSAAAGGSSSNSNDINGGAVGTTGASGSSGASGSADGGGGYGGHIEVVALRPTGGRGEDTAPAEVVEEIRARVGPRFPGLVLQQVDETLALLKDRPWRREHRPGGQGGGGGGGRSPSAAALAAAAVATGGGSHEQLLGSSPPASFGYEMLRFMQLSVAGSRAGGRKNRSRGSPGGLPSPGPGASAARQALILQHLIRLKVPTPSRQRPLGGMWTGVYGPHGLEIVCVSYEAGGAAGGGRGGGGGRGRVVGTKVTGDANVPAGEETFWVDAEPLPQPWPLEEVTLITERALYTADPEAALADAVAMAEAAAEQQRAAAASGAAEARPPPGVLAAPVWATMAAAGAPEVHADPQAALQAYLREVAEAAAAAGPVDLWEVLAPPTAPVTPPPPPRAPCRVVAVYKGKGRIAGTNFRNPAWIDGRLWVYDNGSIGFLWRGNFDFLVDLERMSPRLLGR